MMRWDEMRYEIRWNRRWDDNIGNKCQQDEMLEDEDEDKKKKTR